MVMFNSKKKDIIYSPINGNCIDLKQLNDGVFSELLLGNGIAFRFEGNLVCSPCYGEVVLVAPTKHAVGIKMKNGAEILVHVGLDTAELNGKGMKTLIKYGERVRPGDQLIVIDRNFMETNNIDLSTIVVVTNSNEYIFNPNGNVNVKVKDELFEIKKRDESESHIKNKQ